MYVFRHLANLQNRPSLLQEKVFLKLFEIAEIASFLPEERKQYEESLKYYRDLKNVVDTSREEGREEGIQEGITSGREESMREMAKKLKKEGIPLEMIMKVTGLTVTEKEKL